MHAKIAKFLGIKLDSIAIEVQLLPGKLKKAQDQIKKALAKRTISTEDLQLLFGFLFFAAKVVVLG